MICSHFHRPTFLFSILSAILLLYPRPVSADFSTPTAIVNATIITGTGDTIEQGTIVLDRGRIVAVGRNVQIPKNALRLDAVGLYVYPGFIDAHSHQGIDDVKRTVEQRERTEDRNPDPSEGPYTATRFANRRGLAPQTKARDLYTPKEEQLQAYRDLGFTAALIAPRYGILSGTSDLVCLSDDPIRRAVLLPDAAMHGSFTPLEKGFYPRTLLGVFAQFRQVMLDAQWHAKLEKLHQRRPTATPRAPVDPALTSLRPLLSGSKKLIFEANTENEIRRALKLADEFSIEIVISGAREAWKVIDILKAKRVPLIVSIKFDKEPKLGLSHENQKPAGQNALGSSRLSALTKSENENVLSASSTENKLEAERLAYLEPLKLRVERRRRWSEQVANIIKLSEAGVPFALRTSDFKKPGEFFVSVRRLLELGLPEEALIQALSVTPAKILGFDAQLGTIAPGKIANLTIATKQISDKNAVAKYVFIDGKRFDRDSEQTQKPTQDTKPATKKMPADSAAELAFLKTLPKADWPIETEADRKPRTQTHGTVFIQNGTILPVTSPRLESASILIRDGKIAAMDKSLTPPPGVTVIDATGRFIVPGLVDCHSHLGVDAINESPLAISAEVRMEDVLDPHAVGLFRAIAGGTTTHHVMHGSANPIGGQNTIVKIKYGKPAEEMLFQGAPPTVKFALGENVIHANFPKRWGKRYPVSRMGVEGTIRTALEAAHTYRMKFDTYREQLQAGLDVAPPRRDLRLEALADILAGNLTVHSHCYRSDEILRLLAVAEEFGVRIGVLQHVLEGYRITPEIARHGAGASTFSNDWAYKVEAYGAIPHNAALMTHSGISTSVNSDSPLTIRYMGQEAAKCIRWGGLDEHEALRLVTINPAEQLQIADRVGSLEVGKDGDVAIFDGHPLNTFSKCVATIIDGEVVFEDGRASPNKLARSVTPPAPSTPITPRSDYDVYAIVGGTIHTISGPIIENGTVVILNDKIHAVGKEIAVPPGAGIVDATGLHVYPGLIDAGSRIGLMEISSLRSTRDFSEIGAFNPHLHASSAFHPHSAHIRIARTVGITTALATPTGQLPSGYTPRSPTLAGGRIYGQSAVVHLEGWTTPEMLVKNNFGLHMAVPSLPVQLPEKPEARKKLIESHKKAAKRLAGFMEQAKHFSKVAVLTDPRPRPFFEVDLSLKAMIPYIQGKKPVVFRANTYKQIVDTLRFAEKHALKCIISGGKEAWKLADYLAKRNIPVILGTPLSYPSSEFEPWDSVYRTASILNQAGVKFCFASESAAEAYNLGTQAGMSVAHGLPKERAEYALTLGAAEILGIDHRVGSIEAGKQADILVSNDSPLQTASVVTHLFINGKPIELTSLHTEQYTKFKSRPAPPLPPAPKLLGAPNLTR